MDFEALRRRHPYVFQILPSAFMLSFDPGWMAIYDRLFTDFEDELLQDPASLRRFRLRQLKEKFGCMRVYYGFEDPGRVPGDLRARLRELTRQAEQQSMKTCQRCGQPGELRTFGGWVATLCARHAKQASVDD